MLGFRKLIHHKFSTLILAEHNGKNLSKNSLKLLAAGKKFGEDVSSWSIIDAYPNHWGWIQGGRR